MLHRRYSRRGAHRKILVMKCRNIHEGKRNATGVITKNFHSLTRDPFPPNTSPHTNKRGTILNNSLYKLNKAQSPLPPNSHSPLNENRNAKWNISLRRRGLAYQGYGCAKLRQQPSTFDWNIRDQRSKAFYVRKL